MRITSRLVAIAAGTTLVASTMGATSYAEPSAQAPSATARAAVDDSAATLASRWLVSQLDAGKIVGEWGYDAGASVDAGLALAAVGKSAAVAQVSTALESQLASYIGDGTTESYAGPVAKAAVFARAAGKDPRAYGGVDLVQRLEERVADSGVVAGRLGDKSEWGDYANVFGQAYAVEALAAAHSTETAAAADFLVAQQCTSGAFRLYFNPDTAAAQQGCVQGAKGSEPDPDATARAVIALVNARQKGKTVLDALDKAGAWLLDQQRASGALAGGSSTSVPNTNTTALAGRAFALLRNHAAAADAARWVRRMQPVDKAACRTPLAAELGAVAYVKASLKDGRTNGITDAARREWQVSSAEAAHALLNAPASADATLAVVPKRTHARAGRKLAVRITGLAPGEAACIQVKGSHRRVSGNKAGTRVSRKLTMPRGNRKRTIKLVTATQVVKVKVRVHN